MLKRKGVMQMVGLQKARSARCALACSWRAIRVRYFVQEADRFCAETSRTPHLPFIQTAVFEDGGDLADIGKQKVTGVVFHVPFDPRWRISRLPPFLPDRRIIG